MELKNFEDHIYIKIIENIDFEKAFEKLQEKDLIIDLSKINFAEKIIASLKNFVISKKNKNISVVFICQNINYENFDEEIFNIVPSYLEAKDVLELERIKKDLGD